MGIPVRERVRHNGAMDAVRRAVLRVVGALAAMTGAFFAAVGGVDLVTGGDPQTDPAVLVGLLVVGLLLVGCGVWMIRAARPRFTLPPDDPEARVLALAEARGSRLTVDEVAAHCHLSRAESKRLLDKLTVDNAAEMDVTDGGVLVYTFPGLLSPAEKRTARDF